MKQVEKRFDELLHQGEDVANTNRKESFSNREVNFIATARVDSGKAEAWATSCLSFLGRVMTRDSEHYRRFEEHARHIDDYVDFVKADAVLRAAKNDYEGGYLFDVRKRVQAEVFDDFLEQANYLLQEGFFQVAAVVAGAVLEDGLRKLCVARDITLHQPKLDSMNAELAKMGVYNRMVQKKITWIADIRNKAAHGRWTEFTQEDASEMISGVRRLLTDYVGG